MSSLRGGGQYRDLAPSEDLSEFASAIATMTKEAQKDDSEEFQKNVIAQFLSTTFDYACNTRGKVDLAIYDDEIPKVLFEVKATGNKAEFVKTPQNQTRAKAPSATISLGEGESLDCHKSANADSRNDDKSPLPQHDGDLGVGKSTQRVDSLNDKWGLESKAFYESILYYLRESRTNNNIKHIILCTAHEFYIINAKAYHKLFANNADKVAQKRIDTAYNNCDKKQGTDTSTSKFYDEIARILPDIDATLEFCYVNVASILENPRDLALFYALLSPSVLLQIPRYIDANTLNERFYKELLYILGLVQVEQNGKAVILPSTTQNTLLHSIKRDFADKLPQDLSDLGKSSDSNALDSRQNALDSSDLAQSHKGESTQNPSHPHKNSQNPADIFDSHIFPLIMLWNNRILFLRLLESMLLSFRHIDKPFLDISILRDFGALNTLFFKVLAVKNRTDIPPNLANIPYLNSSLFEKSALESQGFEIATLQSKPLKIAPDSILRRDKTLRERYIGKDDSLPLLEYLFAFLHAYDFTTTPSDVQNYAKTNHDKLINSAVLGLVFEKLNGYKEGSFYTPSFITRYMCEISIRKIVVEKFQECGFKAQSLIALRNEIDINKLNDANKIFLSIRICDPAVGSGHFLVSALNELIAIKSELGLLLDCDGRRLSDIDLTLENDELLIKDSLGNALDYRIPAHEGIEAHKIQKAIFYTKKELIENCLFGVDINPNSVEICKLRLWIELLKYSYYENIATKELQTLPNIDINIKCGNSLISYFDLRQSLSHYPNIAVKIKQYQQAVRDYKEGIFANRTQINATIKELLQSFRNFCFSDKFKKEIKSFHAKCESYSKKYGNFLAKDDENLRLYVAQSFGYFDFDEDKAKADFALLKKEYESIFSLESNKPFEWRFEFPEVLNAEGDFMGFDLIIGNPPYIKEADNKRLFKNTKNLRTYQGKMDIWYHFVGKGFDLVKNQSIVTFIATNNWTTNAGAQKLRNVILSESQILNLVDFGSYMCFDSASIQTMIMEFRKTKSIPKSYPINYSKIEAKNPTDEHRNAVLKRDNFKDNIYLTPTITPSNLCDKTLSFVDSDKDLVLNKILKSGKFYFEDSEIQIGIGLTDKVKKKMGLTNHKAGEGIFQLSTQELQNLNLSKKEKNLIKPLYTTNELSKFFGNPKNTEWVIYTDSSFKNPNSMDNYPNLKRHLDEFKSVITSDNKPYGLHRAKQERFFNKTPSIVSLRKCPIEPIFTYVDFDCYVTSTFFIIQTNRIDMKYLTGILNSKLVAFWLKHKGKMQGSNYQIDKEPLLNIPIVEPNAKNQKIADKIVNLVDKILESKKQGMETNNLEKEIDELIFRLYSLDSREIGIIKT